MTAADGSLAFRVEEATAAEFAVSPTLLFKLSIENGDAEPVQSIVLSTQIRIVPRRRTYSRQEELRLADVFGPSERWGDSLNTLFWAQAQAVVPVFDRAITFELPIACTYDFETVVTKYCEGLDDGVIPLELLFSGTIFSSGSAGLRARRISWESEATFALPLAVWKEMVDRVFPNSAWLRLDRALVERLREFKRVNGLPRIELAIERLLEESDERSRQAWTR